MAVGTNAKPHKFAMSNFAKGGGDKTTDFGKRISVIFDQNGVLWRRF